ncbi:MAG TPA: GreA/GreB family elongation factor [Candidatus Pacearchaeota archaeon]|nr:GreA/GreB family elongation factor [Candidatus Pacearchaeota archaeon]
MEKNRLIDELQKLLKEKELFNDREALEIQREIAAIKRIDFSASNKIKIGSLVLVKDKEAQRIERYFILPGGSGKVLFRGTKEETIVINPNSPLGSTLIGKLKGDHCEVKTPRGKRYLTILSVE